MQATLEHRKLLRLVEAPLKVYHLIARSTHGLMVQILACLITYLLLAVYCNEQRNEKISIKQVRKLHCKIKNKAAELGNKPPDLDCYKISGEGFLFQKRSRTLLCNIQKLTACDKDLLPG